MRARVGGGIIPSSGLDKHIRIWNNLIFVRVPPHCAAVDLDGIRRLRAVELIACLFAFVYCMLSVCV